MEEYLRRVQSRLRDTSEGPIHAVLGGPEADVDTVAATLCLALHLNQKEPSDGVCLPVLWLWRRDAALPRETVRFLQRVKICEDVLLWKEDVDLETLHHSGKLSVTLLRDGLLNSSEYHTLKSSILRVVHYDGQKDDGASSAVTTVTREILQEAAEHIGAALGETLGEALRLQSETLWLKHGRRSEQLEELMSFMERWSDLPGGQHDETKLQDLEQLLSKEVKEFSDGEMTIALTSVTTDKEERNVFVDRLKSFSLHHGYEGVVVLLSISDPVYHPRQQVAVYSNNTEILNQICCELEESSSWSLSGELEPRESFQVYHIPVNTSFSGTPPVLEEEIQSLLKDFVDRRSSVLACHPSSRTSSTEGVAGSIEFSQGSSGINDMDGSDIERVDAGSGDVVAVARVMADGEEDTGGVGAAGGGELVSPDSGMTTIRSSRSSKESSVFLSDDSPVGDIMAGGGPAPGPGGIFLRNPSPLGLLSLSPPVPPERRRHHSNRNRSENFDLFSFDPLHGSDQSVPAGAEQGSADGRGVEGRGRAGSSSLSEFEELSLVDFSAANSLGGFESRNSSIDQPGQIHGNEMIDTVVPPTPVNSLVGSRPPSSCGVRFFPEDVVERINGLQHKDSVSSSLSETWDELGFDTQGALSSSDNSNWNMTKACESPQNILEIIREPNKEMTEKETREEIGNQRAKTLQPQLSLITEQTESYDNWNTDSLLKDQWNAVTLADLQLTPPEEEVVVKPKAIIFGVKEKKSKKKEFLNTLTPDSSKEEDEGVQGKKGDKQTDLLDFWTYSAQKGFLKSDSGTTASYPESLDMWNMTIRDDSLSPLNTPDYLSENSGSFCGLNPNVGASVESPLGYSDGGMEMWNTTIQEDSSSTVTSPEAPENGKDLCQMGSFDASDSPETSANKKEKEEKVEKERGMSGAQEEECWRGNEHNVKIVIEAAEASPHAEDICDSDKQLETQTLGSANPEDETSWDLPVPGMVTSTSEYDNVGAGTWSLTSSPEVSPVVDMIQLEAQSSPFIAVTKHFHPHVESDQYQTADSQENAESGVASEVFVFEGISESDQFRTTGRHSVEEQTGETLEEASSDWREQPCDHSPFLLVVQTSTGEAETQFLSHGQSTETQGNLNESDDVEEKITETLSPSSGSGGERDALKYSPDSLHAGSRDELRSNSDGDSSSGLEMENIIVSGTVKEAEREWRGRYKEPDRQSKGTRKSMETFSMLSYAATVLQAQAAHREHQENTHQKRQCQMSADNNGENTQLHKAPLAQAMLDSRQSNIGMTHLHESTKHTTDETHSQILNQDHSDTGSTYVTETLSPRQSKPKQDTETKLPKSDSRPPACSQTQADEANQDDKSAIIPRSVSPSLRYPSDHFLKAREEVYVHSQISMEDSDEGGQSPSAPPPPCPTSLGNFQVWGGQLARQDTPQAPSGPESPVLTNSSVSHSSSLTGSPLSETGRPSDRGLGLPFSGDLMEEENDEEEIEEETHKEHTTLPKWTSEGQKETLERPELKSPDLLSFTEEPIGGCSFQQTDLQTLQSDQFSQNTVHYYNAQPARSGDHYKWSTEQQMGSHEASQERHSPLLSWSPTTANGNSSPSSFTRHQDVMSQPMSDDAAYQWTGSQNVTQVQTQYGYNYHHIDQRTENQSTLPTCMNTKSNSQQDTSDVYAEFTIDATAAQYSSEQADSYYESRGNEVYSFNNQGSEFQYMAESQYEGDSMCASELQHSQYQTDDHSQYESEHAHYQFDEQSFYRSDIQTAREDHARYVPEGYVHFLFSRQSHQGDGAAGMMMKMDSREEAEDMDNREDPPSSTDLSGGSNQRRKLTAPPMDVSLDHSEGSLLSEDALDTEDEALETGDDLDVNIDELDTPDEADSVDFNRHEDSEAYLGEGATSSASGRRSAEDSKLWRSVVIGEQEHRIDMKCIEPYKRVISHGGYYAEQNAIIVFAACFLPDSDCENYNYVMENLFLYVISTLELMVAEDYMIVYLNGATPRRRMPGFTWMKKCYQMIDRRLKKNLKMFIIVHPSWFIRTLLGITRPFISSKFSSKIKYVNSLQELGEIIPMEYVHIPDSIIKYDEEKCLHKFACMRLDTELQDTADKADRKGSSVV
ncbi:uncharacterized protein LOC115425728 [Sphaeramia orbicularis]|uniref:uncharacterized protein LOC115425728 n=1 Tax=Sphaeramia orbicularis TaxID=375764 RepID=UPI00117EDA03|nr:uncharacterized protein LOC115425728 [Sphaeramia orbicularis]